MTSGTVRLASFSHEHSLHSAPPSPSLWNSPQYIENKSIIDYHIHTLFSSYSQLIHKQIIMNNPRAINSSWSGRSVVLWTTAIGYTPQEQVWKKSSVFAKGKVHQIATWWWLRGAYTLVHASRRMLGIVNFDAPLCDQKWRDNLYIVCNARSQGSVTTENPREVGPMCFQKFNWLYFCFISNSPGSFHPSIIQNRLSDVGS